MVWIKTISYERASGRLRKLYDRIKGPDGSIDNIMQTHGLMPSSLLGHMTLYKNVLHHTDNKLDKWLREAIGTYVSMLNGCEYCVEHHYIGMSRFLNDDVRSSALRAAMEAGEMERVLPPNQAAFFEYARILTRTPTEMTEADLEPMRRHGWDDAVILEVNQIIAYFAYANRTVLGLGVSTKGDHLGTSPSDSENPDNWAHL